MIWLLFLCRSIFGHEGEAADDILFVNWLNMVRAGLMALEYYTPENNKWRQVSCRIQPM
jgi:dipeptidyl-peptidase-3